MAEKLTKTALKKELTRRIEYFETAYGFNSEFNSVRDMAGKSHHVSISYGRYLALLEIRWQIENRLFVGGFAC